MSRVRTFTRLAIGLTLLLSPVWIPTLIWHLRPPAPRTVAVVNYTVPYDDFDSHRGLMWALNYAKVESPGGDGRWRAERDYVGYNPDDRENPVRLSEVSFGAVDMIYFADAYGVYEMDLELLAGTRVQPTRSPQLFGGLTPEDVDTLEEFVATGRDLFVEFNTLPPPTGAAERARMEALLGVRWTGWVGRVFPDLYDITDVPDWFEDFFKERFPGQEMPRDPSLVLFSYSGELIVIPDRDFGKVAPTLRFAPAARDRLGRMRANATFFKWFSLVEPGPMTTVLAELQLPDAVLRSEEFHTARLPLTHPAFTELVVGRSHRYMMAFDGGNIPFPPGRYTVAGVHHGQAVLNRRRDLFATQPAFWQVYVPIMNRILRE